MQHSEISKLNHIYGEREDMEYTYSYSYRYDVNINSMFSGHYHPLAIEKSKRLLIDYSDTVRYCIEHMEQLGVYEVHRMFMLPDGVGYAPKMQASATEEYKTKFHNTSELTVEQAQQIIDTNVHLLNAIHEKLIEQTMLDDINKL